MIYKILPAHYVIWTVFTWPLAGKKQSHIKALEPTRDAFRLLKRNIFLNFCHSWEK